jgi:hypothetical protein
MYNPIQPAGPHRFGHYQYPPVLIPMLSWLPDHSPLGVQRSLLLLGSVGLVAFGVGVARMGRWPLWPAAPLVMGTYIVLTAATVPGEGNLEPFLPGIVALGLCAPWGVSLLVLAAALKVAPGWAVFVLAARSRRDALLAVSATLLILLAVALTIGPDRLWAESVTWIRDIAPSPAQGQYESGHWAWGGPDRPLAAFLLQGNLSPVFAPLYLLGDPYPHELPGWARFYLTAASTGVPLFVAWRTQRLEPRAQAAVVLAAAVLCAPIFRLGYLPMLMPAAVILWRGHERGAAVSAGGTRVRSDNPVRRDQSRPRGVAGVP